MTKTTRARIAAGVRSYWKTVHSVQRKTGLATSAARVVARTLRENGYTTARTITPQKAKAIVRRERAKTKPAAPKYKLKRQRDQRGPDSGISFDFGANVSAPVASNLRKGPIDSLDDWIDAFEDWDEDYGYEEYDVEITPSYSDD